MPNDDGAGIEAFKKILEEMPGVSLKKVLDTAGLTIERVNLPDGGYSPTLRIEPAGEPKHYSKVATTTLKEIKFNKPARTVKLSPAAVAGTQFVVSFNGKQTFRCTDHFELQNLVGVSSVWVATVAGTFTIDAIAVE